MWGIPFVLFAVAFGAFAFRERFRDGTVANDGWGFPIMASIGTCLLIVAAGVLLSWGLYLAA